MKDVMANGEIQGKQEARARIHDKRLKTKDERGDKNQEAGGKSQD